MERSKYERIEQEEIEAAMDGCNMAEESLLSWMYINKTSLEKEIAQEAQRKKWTRG